MTLDFTPHPVSPSIFRVDGRHVLAHWDSDKISSLDVDPVHRMVPSDASRTVPEPPTR
jgi:hypothetical protein